MTRLMVLSTFMCFICVGAFAQNQSFIIEGIVSDSLNNPITNANVLWEDDTLQPIGTVTDNAGEFKLSLRNLSTGKLTISFVGFETFETTINPAGFENRKTTINVSLKEYKKVLTEVQVSGTQQKPDVSYVEIEPRSIETAPIPFGEIAGVLATLPGVVSNNELSSSYSVRGGNYDENLITVNDFVIYRPQIVRTGQQEGLGFVNADLTQNIDFSTGGWSSRYGDKLSSALNIQYKKPTDLKGSLMLSLLGGALSLEGATRDNRFSYLLGVRHKRSEYLLNTLDVDGEYLPRFTDFQFLGSAELSRKGAPNKTTLDLLVSYARNRYGIVPTTRETEFGTFTQVLRFTVAFEGEENLNYDTYQTGIALKRAISENVSGFINTSYVKTFEREFGELEGGYRLCDVETNPASSNFNNCAVTRGIGTNYFSARNRLEGDLVNSEAGVELRFSPTSEAKTGIYHSYQQFDDYVQEYRFIDSLGFVTDIEAIQTDVTTYASNFGAFYDHTFRPADGLAIGAGVRLIYRNINSQFNVNPRLRLTYNLPNQRWVLKFATGVYSQPPLYRELRNKTGGVNQQVKSQSSLHVITGFDYNFSVWGRPFLWTTEVYYKYLWDVVPYDLENVRIRYFGENSAVAYATGIDARVSGEFIPGTESWFSIGVLSTREDVDFDDNGYIRRPTDQRVNLGIFFEDHLPNNPSLRAYLRLLYGSGFPFSPPNNINQRNSFQGEAYNRVDIGFSKIFTPKNGVVKNIWLGLEVLNLIGSANTISYSWIQDINGTNFAVPNNLSNRFFNLKVITKFEK